MRHILCLSCAPWQSIPTRTQQLMSRMKGAEVLFFEPPGEKGDDSWKKPGRKVRPGVTAYTLPPITPAGPRQRFRFHRNQRRLSDFIRGVLRKHGAREPLLWCTTPVNVHLLETLPHKGLVYDCDRYWTGLPLEWESDLALAADVVFVASEGLRDRLSPCCDNIAVVPNGCNYPMFTRADLEVPEELKGVKGPLVGYVGTLRADLDYSPILACAAAHPDWSFLLLGQLEDSPGLRRVLDLERVIAPGRRPLIEVPDYLHRCDVCLDLRREGSGSDVLSTRVFEYLAAGKPVVRHTFPGQVDDGTGLIYQADDPQGVLVACEQAMWEDQDWLRQRRRELGAQGAWDARCEELHTILEANMLL